MQCPFSHPLQRAYLPGFLLACEKDFAITTLADLGYDVELLHAQLCTTFPKQHPFAATVRLELLCILGRRQLSFRSINIKTRSAFLSSSEIAKTLEIIVEKVYDPSIGSHRQ